MQNKDIPPYDKEHIACHKKDQDSSSKVEEDSFGQSSSTRNAGLSQENHIEMSDSQEIIDICKREINIHDSSYVGKGWAISLFIANFIGFIVFASYLGVSPDLYSTRYIYLSVLFTWLFSFFFFSVVRWFPKIFVLLSYFLPILFLLITVLIVSSLIGNFWLCMLLILCPIYAFYFHQFSANHESSKLLMRMVLIVTRNLRSILFFSFMGLCTQIIFISVWCLVMETWIMRFKQNDVNSIQFAFIFIYLFFVLHWTCQVVKNTLMFTISGSFAEFHILAVPHKYTRNSFTVNNTRTVGSTYFMRAITTHFGDICYESLAISPLHIFDDVFKNSVIFQTWMTRFNPGNWAVCAVYGKDFYASSRDLVERQKRYNLYKLRSHFVCKVLDSCAIFTGIIGALVSSLYSDSIWRLNIISGYSVGFIIFRTTNIIFHAGVASTLAVIVESPKRIDDIFPRLFQQFYHENSAELAGIYRKIQSDRPPSYYESTTPLDRGWSVMANIQRPKNDNWAKFLYVVLAGVYVFCAVYGILNRIASANYEPVWYSSSSFAAIAVLFITYRWTPLLFHLAISVLFNLQILGYSIFGTVFSSAYINRPLYIFLFCLNIIMVIYSFFIVAKFGRTWRLSLLLHTYTFEITKQFYGLLAVAYISIIFQIFSSFLFIASVVSWVSIYPSNGTLYPILIFMFFFFNWSTLIVRNIIHSIVTGVFGSYFFASYPKEGSSKKFILDISIPTIQSIFYTFGAIDTVCFKSLFMIPFAKFINANHVWYQRYIYLDYSFLEILSQGKDLRAAIIETNILLNKRKSEYLINGHSLTLILDSIQLIIGLSIAGIGAFIAGELPFNLQLVYLLVFLQCSFSVSSVSFEIFYAAITSIITCFSRNPSRVRAVKPEIYDVIKEIYPQTLDDSAS